MDYNFYALTFYEQTTKAFKRATQQNAKFDVDVLGVWSNDNQSVADVLKLTMQRCRGICGTHDIRDGSRFCRGGRGRN